jgi:outer membrane immunogenic protein
MKRSLLTNVTLGVLALGTPALAADVVVKAAPVAPPVYDWSGFYIGGFGGYAFGNHNLNNALGPAGFACCCFSTAAGPLAISGTPIPMWGLA